MDDVQINTVQVRSFGRAIADFERTSAELLELLDRGRISLDGLQLQALRRIVDRLKLPDGPLIARDRD